MPRSATPRSSTAAVATLPSSTATASAVAAFAVAAAAKPASAGYTAVAARTSPGAAAPTTSDWLLALPGHHFCLPTTLR